MRIALSILQLLIDIIICFVCLRFYRVDKFIIQLLVISSLILFFSFSPLYGFRHWTFWDELKACVRSSFYAWCVCMLFAYSLNWRPLRITASFALFVPCVLAARYVFRRLIAASGLYSIDVVVCGAGMAGQIFAGNINASPFTLRRITGFLDEDADTHTITLTGEPVLGKIRDFKSVRENVSVDEVVIAEPEAPRNTIINLSHRFETYLHSVYILNTYSDTVRGINDIQLSTALGGLLNPFNRLIKTVSDYILGAVALVITFPFMLAIGWKVRSYDGGSALFKHKRVGNRLKPFKVWKFRTMVPGSEKLLQEMLADDVLRREFKAAFKFKNDPRVTPFGKFLRRTSLDELPQIFNVLRGEMSLVGPRPIVEEEVNKYYGQIVSRHIFNTKPGMTGLWQVSGRNDVEDYDLRIKYDMYYIHNWTVFMDIVIMFRTIWVLFNGRGAY